MNNIQLNLLVDIFKILGGKIESRKKIHKIIYILCRNIDKNIFTYTFGLYGPYSLDLDSLLYTLIQKGIIKTSRTEKGVTTYSIYKIPSTTKIISKEQELIIKKLGSMHPWELEIISTILYFNPNANEDEAINIVNNVKPGKFSNNQIKTVWNTYKTIITKK